MRKTVLSGLAILLTGLTLGAVGHGNTTGDVGITSDGASSSSSASASVGPGGVEPRAEVSQLNSSCYSGQNTTLQDTAFSSPRSNLDIDGKYTVNFTGYVRTANPCYTVRHDSVKKSDSVYVLNVTTKSTGQICVQCVGVVSYEASFDADRPFRLEVLHNGENVGNLTHPEYAEYTEERKAHRRGILEGFLRWLSRLFS